MFGAAISCNFNVYTICCKIRLDSEYLIDEGQPILHRLWGDQVEKVTVVAFIMSALTNVPILLYSGEMSLFLNLALSLALTTLIFLVPHYMFHRMLEKARDEMLFRALKLRGDWGMTSLEKLGANASDEHTTRKMLDLIFLAQYEGNLMNRSTWLVDLGAVTELLVVAFVHVILIEILSLFAHL